MNEGLISNLLRHANGSPIDSQMQTLLEAAVMLDRIIENVPDLIQREDDMLACIWKMDDGTVIGLGTTKARNAVTLTWEYQKEDEE